MSDSSRRKTALRPWPSSQSIFILWITGVLVLVSKYDHLCQVSAFPMTPSTLPSGTFKLSDESTGIPILTTTTRLNDRPVASSSSTKLQSSFLTNFDEVVYNAQSAASDLASVSLQNDPTNLLASLPIMYAAGLLTSVSPCVWGLLPLTMSYISQAAGEREDQNATLPTLAFAAGLASVFCSLGVAVATLGGVFGGNLGNNALIPLASNGICLAMGMQLLGFINVPLLGGKDVAQVGFASSNTKEPILLDGSGTIITGEGAKSDKQQASLFRTFVLGGSSALVASPCATPVLTSILAYVANAQNAAIGALLLLGYTLGYSTPLLAVASTGGQALVSLKQMGSSSNTSVYGKIAPWVTPLTGGVLLWYGTNGLLVALFGDPSLAGLAPILE